MVTVDDYEWLNQECLTCPTNYFLTEAKICCKEGEYSTYDPITDNF